MAGNDDLVPVAVPVLLGRIWDLIEARGGDPDEGFHAGEIGDGWEYAYNAGREPQEGVPPATARITRRDRPLLVGAVGWFGGELWGFDEDEVIEAAERTLEGMKRCGSGR